MNYSPKIGFFLTNLDEVCSPSKLERPHKVILGDSPVFMEKTTCALSFFPNSSGQVVHNRLLLSREKNPPKFGAS
jgi:hypothetical protein